MRPIAARLVRSAVVGQRLCTLVGAVQSTTAALTTARSTFFTSSTICYCAAAASAATTSTQQTPPTGGGGTDGGSSGADSASSALDIAMRVNKLKRLHQTGGSGDNSKKQIEYTAWKELNTLTEDQINHAEGKAVALLLNSWAYFAKFWEKGKDGPHGAASEGKQDEDPSVANKKS